MAKSYKLTESQIPEHCSQSVYSDIVADFLAKGIASMEVTVEARLATELGPRTRKPGYLSRVVDRRSYPRSTPTWLDSPAPT